MLENTNVNVGDQVEGKVVKPSPKLTTTDQIEQDNAVRSPSPNEDGQLKTLLPFGPSASRGGEPGEASAGEEVTPNLVPVPSARREASGVTDTTPYKSDASPPEPSNAAPHFDTNKPPDAPENEPAQAQATVRGVSGSLIDPDADLEPHVALAGATHRSSLLRTLLGNTTPASISENKGHVQALLEELGKLVSKL
jgi:hypothetical protein